MAEGKIRGTERRVSSSLQGAESGSGLDSAGMNAALRAARRGEGRVAPNPIVGAALAIPGRRLCTGHHARFGGPHAEASLLDRVSPGTPLPAGSTLFVTLEPCSFHGKTPPCVDRVIAARPARIVVACLDPNPRVAGSGIAGLRKAGLEVVVGPGADEALSDSISYHFRHRFGRALLRVKMAASLDARLGSRGGRERRITGPPADRAVHRERAAADAILVGSGTMAADDPLLTVRAVRGPDPSRIVLDSELRTTIRCRTWRAWSDRPASVAGSAVPLEVAGNYRRVPGRLGPRWERRERLVLATRLGHSDRRLRAFRDAGWEVWELPAGKAGTPDARRVSLKALARRLGEEGFLRVLVEAGPRLAGALFAANLVDELSLYVAPIVLGGAMAWPAGWAARGIPRAARFEPVREAALGVDRHLLWRREGLLEAVRGPGPRGGRR